MRNKFMQYDRRDQILFCLSNCQISTTDFAMDGGRPTLIRDLSVAKSPFILNATLTIFFSFHSHPSFQPSEFNFAARLDSRSNLSFFSYSQYVTRKYRRWIIILIKAASTTESEMDSFWWRYFSYFPILLMHKICCCRICCAKRETSEENNNLLFS